MWPNEGQQKIAHVSSFTELSWRQRRRLKAGKEWQKWWIQIRWTKIWQTLKDCGGSALWRSFMRLMFSWIITQNLHSACCLDESFRSSTRSCCCMCTRSCRRVCDEGLLMFSDLYCLIFCCRWLNCDSWNKISNRFWFYQGFSSDPIFCVFVQSDFRPKLWPRLKLETNPSTKRWKLQDRVAMWWE